MSTRWCSQWEFGNHGSPGADALGNRLAAPRVNHVKPGSINSDGELTGIKGCRVGGSIDAAGQSARDRHATAGQRSGKITGMFKTASRWVATADNCDLWLPQTIRIAVYKQGGRRTVDTFQQGWIGVIIPAQQVVTRLRKPLQP